MVKCEREKLWHFAKTILVATMLEGLTYGNIIIISIMNFISDSAVHISCWHLCNSFWYFVIYCSIRPVCHMWSLLIWSL